METGVTHGFFALKVQHEMAQRGITLLELAKETDFVYEHVRKVVTGKAIPAKEFVRRVAKRLNLSSSDLQARADADRALVRFGPVVWEVFGKKPRLAPLYVYEEYLSDADIEEMTALLRFRIRQRKSR